MEDQKQVVSILITLEEDLRHGDFDKVDSYLDSVDLETINSTSMIAIATITYWGKEKLSKRDSFIQRIEVSLKKKLGEERAEKLLRWRR